ncbi:hypothetical protein [Brachyspira sp.]|uniref:hypothetical protein n=1 Tax=Brachyspira sp. TaxID=1977261 RepID=UPI00262D12CB|nr:hypothetical protein [Brachyspira sp.]
MIKIIDKTQENRVNFYEIRVGQIFKYQGLIYIKLDSGVSSEHYNSMEINGSGNGRDIDDDSMVLQVDVEIIVRNAKKD